MSATAEKEIMEFATDGELVGGVMLRINVFHLFNIGVSFSALRALNANTRYSEAAGLLDWVEVTISQLLGGGMYRLKSAFQSGTDFVELIRTHKEKAMDQLGTSPIGTDELGWAATEIQTALERFQPLLGAELGVADAYLVLSKGGFDTTQLVENGISMFPTQLPIKVPDAVADCNAAARCIAFELPTAAGFHLHRANEAVLIRYYDVVTNNAPRPSSRTVGGYLNQLTKQNAGDPKVIAALTSIKDLHRNPVVHPEHSLEDVEEALALYGLVNTVMVHMLRAIPIPTP